MAAGTTRSEATQSFFIYVKDPNTGVVRRIAAPGDVQIGLEGKPAELQLFGRLALATTTYVVDLKNKGIINASNDDTVIAVSLSVTPLSGRIKVYLPSTPREGQLHFIKDYSGTALSVPIDIIPATNTTIDNQSLKTLSVAYSSLALIWLSGSWRILVAGFGDSTGGSGAPPNATYVTLSNNPTLTNERRLNVSGTALRMIDDGPNADVILDLALIPSFSPGFFQYASLTIDAYGRITHAFANGTPAPQDASFITISAEPGLTNERSFVAGTGIKAVDGGTTFTISINDNIVATVSGASFSGPVNAAGGLSGSLQRLSAGQTYLAAGTGISIITQSSGQVLISNTGTASSSLQWIDSSSQLRTSASVSIDSSNRFAAALGTDVYFFVSGTVALPPGSNGRHVGLFGGGIVSSGTMSAFQGFSGSLTNLTDGRSFIVAGSGIVVSSGSNGQIVFSATTQVITGGFADVSASYITIGNTGSLPNERALAAGTGITLTDNGPGSTLVINSTIVGSGADVSASYVTIGNTGSLPNERALTAGSGITITDNGPNNTVVISALVTGSWADVSASYITIGNTGSLPNERKLSAGTGISLTDNGPNSTVVISATGPGGISPELSASYVVLTATSSLPNDRVLTAGSGISLVDNGPGSTVVISSTVTASAGDPNASYIVITTTSSLANDRRLAVGAGLSLVDSGAGNAVTINLTGTGFADVSASYITINNTGSLPNERMLVAGTGIVITDNGPNNSVVISSTGGSGSTPGPFDLELSTGVFSTGNDGSNPKKIGGKSHDTSVFTQVTSTSTIIFHALLETTNVANPVSASLFKYSGSGSPAVIVTIKTTSSVMTEVSADVSTFFRPAAGAGIFTVNLNLTTASITDSATSTAAWLRISP